MMTRRIRLARPVPTALVVLAALALTAAGCKSEDTSTAETEPETETPDEAEGELEAEAETDEEAVEETDAEGDFIRVLAKHAPEKDGDPVVVEFHSFEVTSATFDPENLEGGEATVEVDLTSLETGNEERDAHLLSPDYLNTEEHGKAIVAISGVEAIEGDRYKANADVTVHGVEVTWPLELEVVERGEDSIRVRGEHTFDRIEFQVGQEEVGEDADPVAREMVLEAELTVSPS